MFPEVKRFLSSLFPEYISILLWRETKDGQLSAQDRNKNDSFPDFETIHTFLAQPLQHHLLSVPAAFIPWGLFSVEQTVCFSLVYYFALTSLPKLIPIHPFKLCGIIFYMMSSYKILHFHWRLFSVLFVVLGEKRASTCWWF